MASFGEYVEKLDPLCFAGRNVKWYNYHAKVQWFLKKFNTALLCVCVCVRSLSHIQLFATSWTTPARLLCPWDFSGKSTGGGVAVSSSRRSSQPRDRTCVSWLAGRFSYTAEPLGEQHQNCCMIQLVCFRVYTSKY